MGMDLASESGRDWRFTNWAFCNSLRLAKKYGWKPQNDLEYYFSNDGQLVEKEDAFNIGKALLSCLDDIPEKEAKPLKSALDPMDFNEVMKYQTGEKIAYKSILEVFSGVNKKEAVRDFALFCQLGSFKIY